jgi:DNA-binding NarL/FixJ family response regulator
MKPIQVIIVDDHRVLMDALTAFFDTVEDVKVQAHCSDGVEIIQAIETHCPDVILCDLEMPGMDSLGTVSSTLPLSPHSKILVLTAFPTDGNIQRALRLGVAGFVSKDEPAETVLEAVRRVHAGARYYSPVVHARVRGLAEAGAEKTTLSVLTPREIEIFRLAAQGLTVKQIAGTLLRSDKTVDRHLQMVMKKLDVHSRVDLTRMAIREGIVQP